MKAKKKKKKVKSRKGKKRVGCGDRSADRTCKYRLYFDLPFRPSRERKNVYRFRKPQSIFTILKPVENVWWSQNDTWWASKGSHSTAALRKWDADQNQDLKQFATARKEK